MTILYVGYPCNQPNFRTVNEALTALQTFDSASGIAATRVQGEAEKVFPAPKETHIPPVTIKIAPGVYQEQFVIHRPNVTLEGENAETTVLTYHLGGREILEDGLKRGTFRTASVRINAQDFTARNLTFENSAGFGYEVGQALALYVDGDRAIFENCRFLGSQDTLFTAPLPLKEFEPGGFRGPGEHKPRILGRHYYKKCFIQGDIDFIFGSATAYFEDCTLFSKKPGSYPPHKNSEDEDIFGYIAAASTPEDVKYGYVFKNCNLTGDCPPGTVYLGRPWREFAKTVYIDCCLGDHIHPAGWQDWNKTHGHFYFAEYGSYGPGAMPESRASFSHQLSEGEAAEYTIQNVLGAPDGWIPLP